MNTAVRSVYELNSEHTEGSHAYCVGTSYLEADFRSRNELSEELIRAIKPHYTRLKKLPDGSYILYYNDSHNGLGIRTLKSKNCVDWEDYSTVFEQTADKLYANPDAIVLQNGELLCCAAWRHTETYYRDPTRGGISIKRSRDNGKTWGEEQVIFLGINWEPYITRLRSGELQIYWTNTTCHILPSCNNTSTGTAILRSFDNGYTWTGDPTVPYTGQVIVKQATELIDGVQFYTDQMPVAIELQNGMIALALESRLDRNRTYRVTMAYSSDNWSESIPADGEGPEDKFTNLFIGTAPYIRQFPSGEVVLRHSRLEDTVLRVADTTAHVFNPEEVHIPNSNLWGSIELDSDHTVIAVSTARHNIGTENELRRIVTQKAILCHKLHSLSADGIIIDGDNSDWEDNRDALFVGSASQAQATYRFARDKERLCILIDRLDRCITKEDTTTVRIATSTDGSYLNVTVSPDGITEQYLLRGGIKQDIKCFAVVNTIEGEGYIAEISIPAEYLPDNVAVFPSLKNKDGEGETVEDMPDGFPADNTERWIPVVFE